MTWFIRIVLQLLYVRRRAVDLLHEAVLAVIVRAATLFQRPVGQPGSAKRARRLAVPKALGMPSTV